MIEFEQRKHRHAHIEIAPLVDVVFLLLLFFMLTYQISAESAIKIRLPESKTAEVQGEKKEITVTINSEGKIYIDEKETALESVRQLVTQKLYNLKSSVPGSERGNEARETEPVVNIKSDQNVSVGLLIKVTDEVKSAGCSTFNIVTMLPSEK